MALGAAALSVAAKQSKVGVIQCVFDTNLSIPLASDTAGVPAECVRDYTLECRVNGEWRPVARVRDNIQRFRRHEFVQRPTDKIRLTVEGTHGLDCARVMEIRAYENGFL